MECVCVCVCLSVGSGNSCSTLCAYLCCRIHGGSEFNKLCHHLHMALFGGEMESVQAILNAQKKKERKTVSQDVEQNNIQIVKHQKY